MKTPTKKPSSEMGTPPSTRGRIYKKYEVLVLSLADAHSQVEEVRGSPDVGVAYVGVPGAALTGSRLAQHANASRVLELVQHAASGFAGVLVDSLLDPGVALCRERVDVPVVGLFWPALAQALGLAHRAAVLHVYPGPARGDCLPDVLALEELARLHGIQDRVCAIECLALGSLPRDDEAATCAMLAEKVDALAKRSNAGAVVVGGIHALEGVRLLVRQPVVVIDASLSGLSALESMLRQNIGCSRRTYPKTEGDMLDE